MMKHPLFFFLFLLNFAYSNEEIVVSLPVDQFRPAYLHSLYDNHSGFTPSYLKQLEGILCFDLNWNGRMRMLLESKECALQAKKEKKWNVFDADQWKRLKVAYVVKATIGKSSLSIAGLDSINQTVKGIEGIPLTGSLDEDRKILHGVADALYQAFFKETGIASSTFLYTVSTSHPQDPGKSTCEIWQCDYDGANARQVTFDQSINLSPAFVPAKKGCRSTHFLYVSYQKGAPKIYAAALAEGSGRRIVPIKGDQLTPAVSFQSDKIAFISDASGNPDLFIHKITGSFEKPQCIFSSFAGAQGCPSFSPDGRQIAFVSNKDGHPRIYIIPLNPSHPAAPVLISKRSRDNTCPAWSPDGTKIAYCAVTKGVRQLWIYDLQTGKENQITDSQEHKENPSWASSSRHLVYNSSGANGCELFFIDLTRKETFQVTHGKGEKRFPSWEPLNNRGIVCID